MSPIQPSAQLAGTDDEIDLADIGRTICVKWRKIVLLAAVTTLFAVLYVLHSRPSFTIDGSLYLGDAQTSPSDTLAAASGASDLGFLAGLSSVSDVETQIELIRAKALVEQAILEAGLNAPVTAQGAPSLRYWRWKLFSGGSIDAFAPKPGDVQALFATLAEPTSKTAHFQIVFGDNGSYQIFRPGGWFVSRPPILSGMLGQPAAGGGLSLVLKPAIDGEIPAAGSRFHLAVTPAEAVEEELLAKGILTVSAGGTVVQPTKVANLEIVYPNPYAGQSFLSHVMQDFIATQVAWKTQSASVTEQFIADQLNNIQDRLSMADRNLAVYQSKTGILDVPTNAKEVLDQLTLYEEQRLNVQLQQKVLQQLADEIAHPVSDINPYLVSQTNFLASQTNDLVLGQLAGSLSSAQAQLQALRVQFKDNAPEVKAEEASIGQIQDSIRTVVGNDLSLSVKSLADIDALISQFQSQLKLMPAESLQVIALSRSSDVYGGLYVLLMQKKEDAEVSKAGTIINTRVVTPPELPLTASKPNAGATILIGLFLGLFAGAALVLSQRALSDRFQTDDEIRRAVPLALYGLIPRRPRGEDGGSILPTRPQGVFAEAFRLLRSNLYQSAPGAKIKVILVTSPSPGDGKTTLCTNLAKSLADYGRKVLVIDADLHRGRLHGVLQLNQAPGLTEWLLSGERSPLQAVPGERFSVLTSGVLPPNPSELLNEAALGMVFASLRDEFDHLIVDGPPLPAVSDTMSLGQHADLILSIIRVGYTKRRSFVVHNETVGSLNCRQGIVINGVINGGYGYGYGYRYGYGYGSQGHDEAQPRNLAWRLRAWLGYLRALWQRLG